MVSLKVLAQSLCAFMVLGALTACSSSLDKVEGPCEDLIIIAPSEKTGTMEAIVDRAAERQDADILWVNSYSYGKDLRAQAARCEETPLVLAGYGDDAVGLHLVAALFDDEEAAAVAQVMLVSDRTLNIDDTVKRTTLARTKTFNSGVNGPGRLFPENISEKVIQVCSWRDGFCNEGAKQALAEDSLANFYQNSKNLNKISGRLFAGVKNWAPPSNR